MNEVHYIWIEWESSTGSHSSRLIYNGKSTLEKAKKAIDTSDAATLYAATPRHLKDCIRVRVSAQNIKTGKTLYSRDF